MRLALAAVALAAVSWLAAATAGAAGTPSVDARAWLVENPVTGEVLLSHDARYETPIASITKLMTVIVALQHLKLGDVVSVDPRAAAVGQESVYLEPHQQITVADLVKAALIQSANDAADALALATAPSFPAFASLMNSQAAALGLTDTHFVRPDGLDAPGEHSSARDVTRLAIVAMKIPAVRDAVRHVTGALADGRQLHTWNDLLGVVPGVFGVKTGHTDEAGWSQVAAVKGDGATVYATILGSPSRARRNADLQALIAYGLNQYRRVDAVSRGRGYATVQLPYGRAALKLVAASPLEAVVRTGAPLTQRIVAPVAMSLPVEEGQVLGKVEVYAGGRLLGSRPLVASRAVAKPGVASRMEWYAGRTVHDVVGLVTH
jgi:D-alanyl-D-alanine carboxypeptidase (penicillin-binding protein 5/6)